MRVFFLIYLHLVVSFKAKTLYTQMNLSTFISEGFSQGRSGLPCEFDADLC